MPDRKPIMRVGQWRGEPLDSVPVEELNRVVMMPSRRRAAAEELEREIGAELLRRVRGRAA